MSLNDFYALFIWSWYINTPSQTFALRKMQIFSANVHIIHYIIRTVNCLMRWEHIFLAQLKNKKNPLIDFSGYYCLFTAQYWPLPQQRAVLFKGIPSILLFWNCRKLEAKTDNKDECVSVKNMAQISHLPEEIGQFPSSSQKINK